MNEDFIEIEQIYSEISSDSEENIVDDTAAEVLLESETESDTVQIANEDIESIVSYINSVSGNNEPESDSVNYEELLYNYLTENSVLNPTPVVQENFFYKEFSEYDSAQIIGVSTLFLILIFLIVYIIKE